MGEYADDATDHALNGEFYGEWDWSDEQEFYGEWEIPYDDEVEEK